MIRVIFSYGAALKTVVTVSCMSNIHLICSLADLLLGIDLTEMKESIDT